MTTTTMTKNGTKQHSWGHIHHQVVSPWLKVDASAPPGRLARDPNQVLVARTRERTMQLMSHPNHESLQDWIQDTVMRVTAGSDRSDNFVMPWIMRTRYMEVTLEEFGVIQHAFVRLDRLLVESLKNVLERFMDLYWSIDHEDLQSFERN